MSRTRVATVAAAIVFCLGLAPAAVADTPQDEPAGVSGPEPAAQALNAGRRAKGERDLARAEGHFQDALAAAERGGEVYRAALEELTYHLPLMRVERYVLEGQWQKAERLLQDLLEWHRDDERKSEHLVGLIAELRERSPSQGGVYTRKGDGERVVELVQRRLDRYRDKHGRYPHGYDELNKILPAGRYPLDDYDIVRYVGRGGSYGLTLRSKADPANQLTVQKTGLVQ